MTDWIFLAAALAPVLIFAAAVPRFRHHIRLLREHVNDPEALAEAIRQSVEESGGADGDALGSAFAERMRSSQNSAPFGVGSSRPPGLPAPYGESEGSGVAVWLTIVVAIAIAAVAWQVQ